MIYSQQQIQHTAHQYLFAEAQGDPRAVEVVRRLAGKLNIPEHECQQRIQLLAMGIFEVNFEDAGTVDEEVTA